MKQKKNKSTTMISFLRIDSIPRDNRDTDKINVSTLQIVLPWKAESGMVYRVDAFVT